jgi:hypothetical protein
VYRYRHAFPFNAEPEAFDAGMFEAALALTFRQVLHCIAKCNTLHCYLLLADLWLSQSLSIDLNLSLSLSIDRLIADWHAGRMTGPATRTA